MIAIDTSSLIAYLSGDHGKDVEIVDEILKEKMAVLPPVVLSEILSDPKLSATVKNLLQELPTLELLAGFWERAGLLRSCLLSKGYKARLADTLIAQICIDHKVPLVTRDRDFKHYEKMCGLILVK